MQTFILYFHARAVIWVQATLPPIDIPCRDCRSGYQLSCASGQGAQPWLIWNYDATRRLSIEMGFWSSGPWSHLSPDLRTFCKSFISRDGCRAFSTITTISDLEYGLNLIFHIEYTILYGGRFPFKKRREKIKSATKRFVSIQDFPCLW